MKRVMLSFIIIGIHNNMLEATRSFTGPSYEESLEAVIMKKEDDKALELLTRGANPAGIIEKSGKSLVHRAIQAGNYIQAQLLIERGARIDTVFLEKGDDFDFYGWPYNPLLFLLDQAFQKEKYAHCDRSVFPLIQSMLEKNIDLKGATPDGNRALHLLAYLLPDAAKNHIAGLMIGKRKELLSDLNSLGRSCLFDAVLVEDGAYIRWLIGKGASLAQRDKTGMTILMAYVFQCRKPRADIIQLLVDEGADVTARDNKDRDVRYYASHSDKSEQFINFLLGLKRNK